MAHDEKTDRSQVEMLQWWGVATLFRAPLDPDPAHADIALVGVPHASGNYSTERDQHMGPRAVRNVSANARRYHAAFDFDPWQACRINDLGDAVCLMPTKDLPNQITAMVATAVFYEVVGLIADRHAKSKSS